MCLPLRFGVMEGVSKLFSSSTLAEGLALVAGLADMEDLHRVDPELESTQALKSEIDVTAGSLADAMWDDAADDDRFILHAQAWLGAVTQVSWFINCVRL